MANEETNATGDTWVVHLPASVAAEAERIVGVRSRNDAWVRELVERELDRLRNWATEEAE
ncbi:hypothetical protein [Vulgatibacter sp.]|uniref:hypothetical protein n=1 Tax=Vulgatibacter sp. TaxID=1971226 RepID=UPI0035698726